jgi:hypothetical protein
MAFLLIAAFQAVSVQGGKTVRVHAFHFNHHLSFYCKLYSLYPKLLCILHLVKVKFC